MLVQDISYVQALRSIRELVLDVGLVQSFKVSGQDLSLKKTPLVVEVGDTTKDINPDGDFSKLYDFIALLVEKGVVVEILPDYVPTEYITGLIDFTIGTVPPVEPDPEVPITQNEVEEHVIKAKNYFTDATIESVMIEFFANYIPYDGRERTTQEIFDNMSYFYKRKMILWIAYYLVDRRRMQMASTMVLIGKADGSGDMCGGSDFKNTKIDVTTRIGDVYTEVEREDETGSGLDGFTSLWGDKYGYLTKLQLYIRSRFEKMFNDFSLRDDVMISQSFRMEKTWQNDAWIDTHGWSYDTLGILVENRD